MSNPPLEGPRAYLCPKCPSKEPLGVIDSRPAMFMGEPSIRRRRCCYTCNHRFTTFEVTEEVAENRLRRSEQLERAAGAFIRAVQEQK
jgi:transcriptional regulator NrdR family protein